MPAVYFSPSSTIDSFRRHAVIRSQAQALGSQSGGRNPWCGGTGSALRAAATAEVAVAGSSTPSDLRDTPALHEPGPNRLPRVRSGGSIGIRAWRVRWCFFLRMVEGLPAL